jgi:predicted nuclease with TOPRIM domain
MRQQKETADGNYSELVNRFRSLEASHGGLEGECDALQSRFGTLDTEREALQAQFQKLSAKYTKQKTSNKDLTETLTQSQSL